MSEGKEFMEKLEQEAIEKEQEDVVALDLETGADLNNRELIDFRISQIIKKEEKKTFSPGNAKKQETIDRKREDWEADKEKRKTNAIISMMNTDAMNPWLCRICLSGIGSLKGGSQFDLTEYAEKDIVAATIEMIGGKTVVTYNGEGFDLIALKFKAVKYGIKWPHVHSVDLMKEFGTRWGFKKELLSLDMMSAIMGVMPNPYQDVDASKIGGYYDEYHQTQGQDAENIWMIQRIRKYNASDIRQTIQLYFKFKEAGLI